MPELPDVENYRRYFEQHALGHTIVKVAVTDARLLQHISPRQFEQRVKGSRFESVSRHGKHMLARLQQNGWIAFHFGMTGRLDRFEGESPPAYARLIFDFPDGGHLAFVDPRKLGRVFYTEDAERFIANQKLGIDALDQALTPARFRKLFANQRGKLKPALMDQAVIAGIGNIYGDEILFQARLHPEIPLIALSDAQWRQLYAAMVKVLKTAIASGAGSEELTERLPRTFLLRDREAGAPCPRCKGKIVAKKIGGRTSYFCPRCQPAR